MLELQSLVPRVQVYDTVTNTSQYLYVRNPHVLQTTIQQFINVQRCSLTIESTTDRDLRQRRLTQHGLEKRCSP